jgi:hypothetical protein
MARSGKALITAALLFASSPACAEVLLPPEQYDRPVANATVIHLPYRQVHAKCVELGAQNYVPGYGRIRACAVEQDQLMVLPTPESVGWQMYTCLYRHEAGHLNGWWHTHPGGRQSGEC